MQVRADTRTRPPAENSRLSGQDDAHAGVFETGDIVSIRPVVGDEDVDFSQRADRCEGTMGYLAMVRHHDRASRSLYKGPIGARLDVVMCSATDLCVNAVDTYEGKVEVVALERAFGDQSRQLE